MKYFKKLNLGVIFRSNRNMKLLGGGCLKTVCFVSSIFWFGRELTSQPPCSVWRRLTKWGRSNPERAKPVQASEYWPAELGREVLTHLGVVFEHQVIIARVELAVEDSFEELQPVPFIVPERDLVHDCFGQDWFLEFKDPIERACPWFLVIKHATDPIGQLRMSVGSEKVDYLATGRKNEVKMLFEWPSVRKLWSSTCLAVIPIL